jgi:DNA repair protein RecN (Recombination protein N)
MLNRLKIENFVLMKTCDIEFSSSLNIITGETGTGKSVLLSALQLLLGAKADSESIRHGESSALIEGSFFLKDATPLLPHLHEYEVDLSQELLIRREILKNGKHKTYMNGMLVPMNLIRTIAPFLLDHCDLESCSHLRSPIYALERLDLFADAIPLQKSFHELWKTLLSLKDRSDRFHEEERFQEIEMSQLEKEIEALESLQLCSFNEEELFEKYQKSLSQKKEEFSLFQLEELIEKDTEGLLSKLFHAKQLALKLHSNTLVDLIEGALIQMKEASYSIQTQKGGSLLSDEDLQKIDQKLSLYNSLKRKLRVNTTQEMNDVLQIKIRRKEELINRDEEKKALTDEITALKAIIDLKAHTLSARRKEFACHLAQEIERQIRTLNMPQAIFNIQIDSKERSPTGDDACTFFFVPNSGERTVDVHKGASNGELARIFLALSTILASKEQVSTILFDEIDSNIGGLTALSVGTLLEEISKKRQVIAITHFPQVAQFAHAHFALAKEVIEERTITSITHLKNTKERKQEHLRMSGIK